MSNLISDCCGACSVSNGDSETSDIGICPECGDHCTYVEENDEDYYSEFQQMP